MVTRIVLHLLIACLAMETAGQDYMTVTKRTFSNGIMDAETSIGILQDQVDTLTSKVINAGESEEEWFAIMTDLAEFIKDGAKIYYESLMGIMHVGELMFEGHYLLTEVQHCSSLHELTRTPGFGSPEFFAKMEVAMAKDLLCFSNMLKEISAIQTHSNTNCPTSEDDAIDLIATTIKWLFRFHNDAERFLVGMDTGASTYNNEDFSNEISTRTDLMAQLTMLLKKKK